MKKDFLVLLIIGVVLTFVITGTKIQSVDDYYLTHIDEITEDSETIFLRIECHTILDNWELLDPNLRSEKYVPTDGEILPLTEYVLRPNDTVYSILDRAIRHNKIHMEVIFSPYYKSVYIRGINNVYEFSVGELSGWMYQVNGIFPQFGASLYKLNAGDVVEWKYTCDLGRDIGGDYWSDVNGKFN